jgi:hypothetical protein
MLERLEQELVDVAPAPCFPWLDGAHDWVGCCLEVLARVLVLGVVAASNIPALRAEPQVNPRITHEDALLANVRLGLEYVDLIEVLAAFHMASLSTSRAAGVLSPAGNRRRFS